MDIERLTLPQIKRLLEARGEPPEELLAAMAGDGRPGVRRLLDSIYRKRNRRLRQREHLNTLYSFEDELHARGITMVAGVDEAGRGPLAGPVVAAAVILPPRAPLWGLDDSKKVPPARREILALEIKKMALDWSVGISTVQEIQLLNIHHASMLAMRRAVRGLSLMPQYLLVDGRHMLDMPVDQQPLVGGDAVSASIAAASILAKVTRDHLMQAFHQIYPQYGFDSHKGYPTPSHLEALARWGPCPIHRSGFQPVKKLLDCHAPGATNGDSFDD
ncbi:ribonuclease HII [Desulfofundulus thermobenzoicus]|uniref:Ribonuclease HII n=1 Tax=Desulfofundulus thermobenzoicus TaxID=29376 RepID=A0A6N7ISX1_9FIRM|nr:ribonuclease HII [Desulfofundulus thermobenzoicus]HHW43090.1 ribonuclease HII [Desulfotomaculum sp.]